MPRSLHTGSGLMNRRIFVARAGLWAAGSAFGSSFLGCNSVHLDIPCLSVAPAPKSLPGTTFIKASQIGCALDCSLGSGNNKYTGGPATDDGPIINAAMAGASASNPITLIIDGSALISGLFLPADGYWSIQGLGCGTGFFVKSGTNNDGIHNGPPSPLIENNPGPPAPPRGMNVSLSNFVLNGNRGNGLDGDSTTGAQQGNLSVAWYFGINLTNLNNIVIENVAVVNSPSFHIRLSNVGNVSVSGCLMQTNGVNTDGLHFDGPANDITISNCSFSTGDDAIALNCPEGYTGNISRVTVTNCTFNSASMMRLYTIPWQGPPGFNIDSVKVSNCSGTLGSGGFLIGESALSLPQALDGLTISNCTMTAPAVLDISANFGSIVLSNITLTPGGSSQDPGYAFVRTSPLYKGFTYAGSSLTFNNCAIAAGESATAALILENNSTISNLIFNGFAGQAQELINILAGSLGQLVINSVDGSSIRTAVSPGGFSSIGSVSGSGVLATNWEFPDAVMANEVPYISANSGAPSIKIGGVVEPYN
jgi:hypothetical protein